MMIFSVVAGILCSKLIRRKWEDIEFLSLRVLGVSVLCLIPLYFLPVSDFALVVILAHIFVFWLNMAMFRFSF
ncbi:hypothetical protein COW36_10640 [bacterium (Candidatus Blackallbacteria) CG17_big_fil_post_rev_8_21_14_2_50_48_46]|uniref:Uncharacterized protein n=1 Tax=bacterium (Candidatus Blackallbacteria) CG17_big_fil_post_rev_8_21_14_2_50_48_46 TaxID=2014261 RepID=A0A2M7G4X5_9BACT|nr:MAG: hypothetical protein COW64_20680 [bacterium (Candidatus Blackallbacteria) CG18_big_fil_WC_8_21_14_2_50_49_26]PIW16925.1 MAG: hypothetical protein COW36_10640 [bacterium (Candidatus Blackallbacteria) CG17_big_fil_post_rev_8_21_14_2_50_48_46]PIW50203.1 MAG: hypothetical protein COW20_03150 [bacterium (Candidatus Blackallbacteria) CG13_big_fil_rev_8_21_14_2_50_49_14]